MANEKSRLSRRTFLASTAALLTAGSCASPREPQRNTATAKFELKQFIEDVKQARAEGDGQAAVEDVLARAVSEPGSVLRELGEPKKAENQTLYSDDDVSIFKIVWAPLMMLVPHNHLMWASIGIYTGRENNIMWKRSGQVIEASTAESLSEKEVFSLPADAIHSVTNPINRLTGAIHIYGADLAAAQLSQWNAETLREEPFDLEKARRLFREANKRLQSGR